MLQPLEGWYGRRALVSVVDAGSLLQKLRDRDHRAGLLNFQRSEALMPYLLRLPMACHRRAAPGDQPQEDGRIFPFRPRLEIQANLISSSGLSELLE